MTYCNYLKQAVDAVLEKNEELARIKKGRSFVQSPNRSYDYLVVGAGAAGCVVASRLSEDPQISVLLLEVGVDQRHNIDVQAPALWSLLKVSEHNWLYFTEPQKNSNNRKILWPIGKMIGGSCAHNGMKYVRGTRGDYDNWEQNYGCDGWSSDECYKYFKKSEGNRVGGVSPEYHNNYGPLKISSLDRHPIAEAYRKGCIECGIPSNNDYNGHPQLGVCGTVFTIDNGRRCSSAEAFITPSEHRPNLDILTSAHVTRVLINDDKTAYGVAFQHSSEDQKESLVYCTREVIICGGACNSPQILMLSGIGPKSELNRHGIECVQDLQGVGDNLRDHYEPMIQFRTNYPAEPDIDSDESYAQFVLHQTGPLTNLGLEVNAFFNTGVRPDLVERGQPDVQLCTSVRGLGNRLGPTEDQSSQTFYGYPSLLQPKSYGRMTLSSSNPFDFPKFDPKYIDHPDDVESLRKAFHKLKEILESDAMKHLDIRPVVPAECPYEYGTDEFYNWIIIHRGGSAYHPLGTCRMGPRERGDTVVDTELRVHGIKGLRVVDNSICPQPPSGNTMAAAIMIGEKGSDLLKSSCHSKSRL